MCKIKQIWSNIKDIKAVVQAQSDSFLDRMQKDHCEIEHFVT